MRPLIPKEGWRLWDGIREAFREDPTLLVPVISGALGIITIVLVNVYYGGQA